MSPADSAEPHRVSFSEELSQLEAGLQEDAHDRRVSKYSKGMRQKVGIAIALAKDAKALILDEPTSGLDPLQIRETLSTIKELSGSHTVLLSTHILSEVEAICDRVIIINRGTLRWDGKLSALAGQAPVLVLEVRGSPGEVLPWLALNRKGLVVFLHPDTGDDLADHSEHAIWMGAIRPLDLSIF